MVKVFGINYKVRHKSLGGLAGYIDFKQKTIYIEKSLEGSDYFQTLIHELVHAVVRRVGINQVIDPQLEEIVAESFSAVMIENFNFS